MKDKREYYSRISRNFTIIAAVLFVCLLLIEISFAENIINTRNHVVEIQMEERKGQILDTYSNISDSVYALMLNPVLAHYISTPMKTPEYYYDEMRLQNSLRNSNPLFRSSVYSIGISRKEENASVITSTGTFPKKFYLKSIGIDHDDDLLDGKRCIAVSRNENGDIENILITATVFTSGGEVIIYMNTPAPSLSGSYVDGIELSIYNRKLGKIQSRNPNIEKIDLSDRLFMLSQEKIIEEGAYTILPVKIPFSDSFLLLTSHDNVSTVLWVTLIASLVIIGALIVISSSRLKENLYRPIQEAVTLLSKGEETDAKDEFALIIENCKKIDSLHEELENAMEAHHQLKEQQKYRAFLRGVQTETDSSDENSYFTVAYGCIPENNDKPDVIFSKIDNALKYIEHFHSIRIDNSHNAYIYKGEDLEQSYNLLYNTLQTLTFHIDGFADMRFAISSPKKGYGNIPEMFVKVEEMLQYRYRIRNKFIITENDIPQTDNLMNYSISDERMFLNAMVSDDKEALSIFDNIVEKNFSEKHRLSQKEGLRFTYSMIGTVNRVFQEFKETPETLLGHPIDFEALYSSRNIEGTLITIKEIVSEILEVRNSRNGQEDDQMIIQMKEYINEHYMENLMLIDLSARYNLTPKYCSTLFKKLSNDTFKNYLNQLRIEKACQKLEENPRMKIQDLSEEVGFQSSNTFIRAFSRIMGITPGTYAENIQKRS